MSGHTFIIVFTLAGQRHGIPMGIVQRAIRAAWITPVADAPGPMLGVLDVAGSVMPVLSLRRRFGLPERAIHCDDHFLIVRMGVRPAVVPVDEVLGIEAIGEVVEGEAIAPGLEQYRGVARLDSGLVLIHDLERFFSPDEWRRLDHAMAEGVH